MVSASLLLAQNVYAFFITSLLLLCLTAEVLACCYLDSQKLTRLNYCCRSCLLVKRLDLEWVRRGRMLNNKLLRMLSVVWLVNAIMQFSFSLVQCCYYIYVFSYADLFSVNAKTLEMFFMVSVDHHEQQIILIAYYIFFVGIWQFMLFHLHLFSYLLHLFEYFLQQAT